MSHRTPHALILAVILLLAGCLRWVGLNWDDFTHSHPDELFLTTIASEVGDQDNLLDQVRKRCADDPHRGSFFNTQCSPYNPNNIEPGSFAYGTLPVYMVHGAGQAVANLLDDPVWREFGGIHLVGRFVNTLADVFAVLLIFMIGRRLFGSHNGLLAAMLYAAAVLPIQLAHFWTVDIIAHAWFLLAFYAAVVISQQGSAWAYLLFGLALGASAASRINVLPAAVLAPLAALLYRHPDFNLRRAVRTPLAALRLSRRDIALLLAAGALSLLTFRLAQPYAFRGPHMWDLAPNDKWLDDMREVSKMAAQQSDGWPPSHQFVGRISYLYPWLNLMIWGLGLPLGLAATLASGGAVIQQVRHRQVSPNLILLLIWLLIYFGWHGGLHFLTMRYYLPIYAVLCLLAAWGLSQLGPRPARLARRIVVIGTFLWAFAFTAIYRHPQTRQEAALWITDRLPATLTGITADGSWQPLNLTRGLRFTMVTFFQPEPGYTAIVYESEKATLSADAPITLRRLWLRWIEDTPINVSAQLFHLNEDETEAEQLIDFSAISTGPYELRVDLDPANRAKLEPGGAYRWKMSLTWTGDVPAVHVIPSIEWEAADGELALSPIRLRSPYSSGVPYAHPTAQYPHILTVNRETTLIGLFIPHHIGPPGDLTLVMNDEEQYTARFVQSDGNPSLLGDGRHYTFDRPVTLYPETEFLIRAAHPLWITGTAIATEGSWDFSTPTRICFRPDHSSIGHLTAKDCESVASGFDTAWYAEVPLEVVEHDSANKQRYMLDTLLKADYLTISSNRMYDALPRYEERYWFTSQYYDDLFAGRLGYRQVARFTSWPRLGPLELPDQVLPGWNLPGWLNELEAEEAFTVYDHPVIYVFKNESFTPQKMTAFVPRLDERNRVNLADAAGPTYTAPQNSPSEAQGWLMVAFWASGFLALGWLAFPLMFSLFPALPLRGFAFGRGAAWLLLALCPWWLTALIGLPFWTRPALIGCVILFIAVNLALYRRRAGEMRAFVREHWRVMVALEVLWLAALGLGIMLRGINPDYWHPWLGGEKHMDLAYLNAVWRAGEFPPPNPWLSGFSINYYYFGFVIAALPLKIFGTAPEIAANVVLATLYGTVFVQVFTLALGVLRAVPPRGRVLLAGLGVGLVMLAGNLGALYLMLKPEDNMADHRWYWYPTRIIAESANGGGGVINEVPLFSFLYGDLHAHIIALLPVTSLLIVLWALVHQRDRWLAPAGGALLGILYMTNTWDILVYLPLVAAAILITARAPRRAAGLLGLAAFGGALAVWPYLRASTLSEYGTLMHWEGPRSLFGPFLLTWGGPLAVLAIWIARRARLLLTPDADAPVEVGLLILLIAPAALVGGQDGTSVLLALWLIITLGLAWRDPSARSVHWAVAFFLAGLLAIEHVVIKGDVDRTNTSFKVSFQLWLWAGLLIPIIIYRLVQGQRAYALAVVCLLLLLPGFLYPLKAIPARRVDSNTAQFTLNGYRFMDNLTLQTATRSASLVKDAGLIVYMRSHLTGYPVIAEAYEREYAWNSRIASYTGLPGVIGWRNHLRQQYPHQTEEIEQRIEDMLLFYVTSHPETLLRLIDQYQIEYIVSGELEQGIFGGRQMSALQELAETGYLSVVYEDDLTRLYHVEKFAQPK